MRTLFFLAAVTLPAFAASATPVTPNEAEDIIETYGASLIGSSPAGDNAHVIDAKFDTLNFSVRLGDCDAADQCSYAMMFATFDLGQKASAGTLEKTNAYNDSYPFGRAFVIPSGTEPDASDAVGVDYVVDLSNETEFDNEDIARFETVLSTYISHWTDDQ